MPVRRALASLALLASTFLGTTASALEPVPDPNAASSSGEGESSSANGATADVSQPPPNAPPPSPPKKGPRIEFEAGVGTEKFLGQIFTRADIALVLPFRSHGLLLGPTIRLQPGQTEYGLLSNRAETGLYIANQGRARVFAGPHLAYTFVVRKTESNPLLYALFGNIGGFGIGANAGASVDIVHEDHFAFLIGGRGVAEIFDGGTAYSGSVYLGVASP